MLCRFDFSMGGCWMFSGLVTPRLGGCVCICAAGHVAAAVRPVHPSSTGGWTAQVPVFIGFLCGASTRPPLSPARTHIGGRVGRRARVCAYAHGQRFIHTYGQGGQVDGLRIGAGLRRPPLVHPGVWALVHTSALLGGWV